MLFFCIANKLYQKEITQTLDLRQYTNGPEQYLSKFSLISVGNHRGSVAGGHYYAYVKDRKSQKWFVCNDNIFGVQFHPEFSYDVTRALMDIRVSKGISIDSDKLEESLNSKNILVNFINIVRSKM